MATPSQKRRGFSRRAQWVIFGGYVIATLGVVLTLALAIVSRVDPRGYMAIRGTIVDITGITSSPLSNVGYTIGNIGPSISAYFRAGSQNRKLREELDRTRVSLIEAKAIKRENIQLKRTLKLVERTPETVVAARLIGSTISGPRRFATLAAGRMNGVRPGQPVIAAQGIIGRVTIVGNLASRVLLLTDPQSTIPLRNTRNDTVVLGSGNGDSSLNVRVLVTTTDAVRSGDVLVTSGTGGLYPPNIPVAIVGKTERGSAIAWPLANPTLTDIVTVRELYREKLPVPAPEQDGNTPSMGDDPTSNAAAKSEAAQ